jgi:monoamine oxidase
MKWREVTPVETMAGLRSEMDQIKPNSLHHWQGWTQGALQSSHRATSEIAS